MAAGRGGQWQVQLLGRGERIVCGLFDLQSPHRVGLKLHS